MQTARISISKMPCISFVRRWRNETLNVQMHLLVRIHFARCAAVTEKAVMRRQRAGLAFRLALQATENENDRSWASEAHKRKFGRCSSTSRKNPTNVYGLVDGWTDILSNWRSFAKICFKLKKKIRGTQHTRLHNSISYNKQERMTLLTYWNSLSDYFVSVMLHETELSSPHDM